MKKLLLILSNIVFFANAQQNTFSKIISDTSSPYSRIFIKTAAPASDNGAILAGGSNYDGTTSAAIASKIDSSGNIIWTKTFTRYSYSAFFNSAAPTNDSGFILSGNIFNNNTDFIFIVRIDSNGDTLWSKSFLPTSCGFTQPLSIQQTNDSGFVFTGRANVNYSFNPVIIVCKLDLNGNVQWTSFMNEANGGTAFGNGIQQTADGGYVLTGSVTSSKYDQNYEIFIAKLFSDGSLSWSKKYKTASSAFCEGYDLLLSNSGFVTAVYIGNEKSAFMKTDLNGNVLWTKVVSKIFMKNTDLTLKCHKNSDNGYLLSTNSCFGSFLTKTDSLANVTWSKTFSSIGLDAMELPGKGFLVVGKSTTCEYNPYIKLNPGVAVIKTDSLGYGSNCISSVTPYSGAETMLNSPVTFNSVFVSVVNSDAPVVNNITTLSSTPGCLDFSGAIHPNDFGNQPVASPNPSQGIFTLTTFSFDYGKLMIYNSMGELIQESRYFNLRTEIDLTSFPKGIYFYKLLYLDGKTAAGKLITTD